VTALTKILFPLPDYRRMPGSLFRWWESRRLTYNLFVGGTGLVTLAAVTLFTVLPPRGPALFRQGLSFAVGLTLLPIPLAMISWVVRLVGHVF
jgi:hypothetical protein